ncbi:MAG TPA: hypothetical protein VIY48_14025 [Candidatus Paceibacterota bacterium]
MIETMMFTACGMRVMPDGNPLGWPNFSWEVEVADMPGDQEKLDALALVQQELQFQVGYRNNDEPVLPIDVAFAALHQGCIPRVQWDSELNSTDPAVPGPMIAKDIGRYKYTVCGILLPSWLMASLWVWADNPLVAYYRAWEIAQIEGDNLLLCGVHEGHHESDEAMAFANPWIRDPDEMVAFAKESWL